MTAGQVALAAAVVLAAAALSAVGVIVAHHWWRIRRGRRAVQAVVDREMGWHLDELVPEQRTDEPSWWEFVPRQRDGEDR
jgi:hypothetical protein